MRSWRRLLDGTPLAALALALMREATGRAEPVEPLRPLAPAGLPVGARVGFWSLGAGVGTSTLAALVAHRTAAAGRPAVLVDLDRWAPTLAIRARVDGANISDALVRPGRERELLSRWSDVPLLPGVPGLAALWDTERILALLDRLGAGRSLVLDLGAGRDALEPALLATLTRLVIVSGTRLAQLQAAFCSVAPLRDVPCAVVTACVGADDEDARAIAARLPWPLASAIPADPFLARDEFAARAPTLRSVDRLVRECA